MMNTSISLLPPERRNEHRSKVQAGDSIGVSVEHLDFRIQLPKKSCSVIDDFEISNGLSPSPHVSNLTMSERLSGVYST